MGRYKEIEGESRQYRAPVKNRLADQELEVMDKELQKFHNGKYTDTKAWLVSKGALNKDGAIKIDFYKPAVYDSQGRVSKPQDCNPILYEQLSLDLDQWSFKYGKKRSFEDKIIESLEEMAEQMHV